MSTDMNPKPATDTAQLPWLGRKLLWLDSRTNVDRVVYALFILCAALFAADFLYHKHTYLEIEGVPGFYALYGFLVCVALVLCARVLRVLLKRREDYYAPKDVDIEDYPEDQLGRETIND